MIAWLILLLRNLSAQSFGDYRFHKNYGDSFYDYGAGVYHAYNGSSPQADANDGVHTDRGVYLDGISSYVTVHSNHWGTPSTFTIPFELLVFTYVISEGPLIYRYDLDDEVMLYLELNSDGSVTIIIANYNAGLSTYSQSLYNKAPGLFNLDTWNLFHFIIKIESNNLEVALKINLNFVSIEHIPQGNYQETASCITLMGHDRSNYLKGIIYSLHIYHFDSFDENTEYTQSCTSHFQSCNICPGSTSKCLLYSSDPSVNNDNVSCSSCTNGCLPDMTCLDCPSNSLPICESGTPLPLPSLCDSSCTGCSGPDSQDCTECPNSNLHVASPPGECSCINGSPDTATCLLCESDCQTCSVSTLCDVCLDPNAVPRTDGSGTCECNPGYFLDSSNNCVSCSASCSTCDSSTTCLSCSDPTAVLDSSSQCSCPLNSTFDGSQCVCNSLYYDSDSSSSLQCDPCFIDCLTCSSPSLCLTCRDPLATPRSSEGCECPANMTIENSMCVCNTGLFMNSSNICEECHEDCERCEDSKICLSCKDSSLRPSSEEGCDCPSDSSLQNGVCLCNAGYFTDSSGGCQPCEENCGSCNETECIECLDRNASVDSEGDCKCPEGSEMVEGQCVCSEGSEMVEGQCVCSEGSEMIQGQCVCSEGSEMVEGQCVCSEGLEMIQGQCVCSEGSEMVEGQCVYSEENELNSSSDKHIQEVTIVDEITKCSNSAATIIISAAVSFAAASTAMLKDPMTLWTLINSVQIFSYIPLHNVNLTDNMDLITKNFEITSYVPNIFVIIYGRSNKNLNIDKEKWKDFTQSVSFYENIGECTTSLILCMFALVILLMCYAIFPRWRNGISEKLSSFKFDTFIRLVLELYLVLVYASIVSLDNLHRNSSIDTESVIGSIFFVLCVLTPLAAALLLKKLHNEILVENQRVLRLFGTLFEEFEITEDFKSLIFYPCFLTRRLIYMISLFYFYNYPKLQFVAGNTCSICMILIVSKVVKFRDKVRFLFELLSEIGICIILFTLSFLKFDLSTISRDSIEYLVITLAFTIIGANFLFIVVKTGSKCLGKCMGDSNASGKVIPLSKPSISGDFEPVFALPRERRGNNRTENNSHIQDRTYLNQIQSELY